MKITLRTLGQEHDITEYVDRPIPQAKSVGDIFNSATLTIPFIKADELSSELDLSYRIPRMSVVEIEDIEDTRQYYVVKADVDKKNDLEYRHDLELKSPEILLSYRPISDYSITQPISEGRVFVNEVSGKDSQNLNFSYSQDRQQFAFITSGVTGDDETIENRVLKADGEYKVSFKSAVTFMSSGGWLKNVKLIMELGGVEVYNSSLDDMRFYNLPIKVSRTATFENIGINELKVYLTADDELDGTTVTFENTMLEIAYYDTQQSKIKYLDGEVEKLLNLTAINVKEFWLDEDTKSRLATVKAFNTQDTETTLYEALNKIANYVKAKVRLRLDFESGRKIVWFEYYDNLAEQEYVEVDNDQVNITSDLNEYTSAFELKNNNILKSNFIRETITLRTDDISQITTENIKIITTYPLDRIRKIEISGKEFKDTSNNVVEDGAIDITPRVVLKDYYDTLDSFDRANTRPIGDTQNNHLWFVRGGKEINGLSFLGNRYEKWIQGDNGNRALYETMACIVQERLDEEGESKQLPVKVDGGLADDLLIIVRIEYYTFSDSSAVIHKDDQLGFEEKILRRLNANDRVNNADMLGAYARQKVNAVGGTKKAISGSANNPNEIPKLASRDNGYRVVSVSKYSYDDEVEFIATLVKDYIYESEYVGIDSDRRLYRVPKDDYVDRVDKALNMLYLSKERIGSNDTPFNLEGLVAILTTSAGSFVPPRIAYLTYDNKQVSKFIDVNALGNTVEFRVGMENNYSAGFKKVIGELNGEPFIYQTAVPYVDIFGTASELGVEYYAYLDNQSLQNFNDYPQGQVLGSGLLGGFIYGINKDAREKSVLSTQIAIMSNEPEVIVYDGLAKFNRQVLNETRDIKMARLHYVPNRDDKFIDISKTDILVNNTQLKEGYVEFNVMYAGNYAWYDNESKELLLVYENAVTGDNRLYFSGVPYEIGISNYKPTYIRRLDLGFEVSEFVNIFYLGVSDVNESVELKLDYSQIRVKQVELDNTLLVNESAYGFYLDTTDVNELIVINADIEMMDIVNRQVITDVAVDFELEHFYLDVVNINEIIELNIAISQEKMELLNFDKTLDVIATVDNNYISNRNINEISLIGVDLGLTDVYSVTLSNEMLVNETIDINYINAENIKETITITTKMTNRDYKGFPLESELVVTEYVDNFYINVIDINETVIVYSDLGANQLMTSDLELNMTTEEYLEHFYLDTVNITESVTMSNDITHFDTHIKDFNININTTETINHFYLMANNITEEVILNNIITKTAIIPDPPETFNAPVVTKDDDRLCGLITIKVVNGNNFKVKVYADNVYMGELNANSNKLYTFSHSLNGSGVIGMGGGYFYKAIKFVDNGDEKTTNFSHFIIPLCIPPF